MGADVRATAATDVSRVRRGDRHVYRCIAGEHLLVAISRATVSPLFALTTTGAALWERLEEWTTPDELARFLVQRYDVTLERAREDVREFLDQLASVSALQLEGSERT